jgi:hypothetical protein
MTTTEMSKAAGPPESVGKSATEGETSNIQQGHRMPETVGMEANNSGVFVENRKKTRQKRKQFVKNTKKSKNCPFCPIAFSNSDSNRNIGIILEMPTSANGGLHSDSIIY